MKLKKVDEIPRISVSRRSRYGELLDEFERSDMKMAEVINLSVAASSAYNAFKVQKEVHPDKWKYIEIHRRGDKLFLMKVDDLLEEK